jgi:hypothetical protein
VLGDARVLPGYLKGGPGVLDVQVTSATQVMVTYMGDDRLLADMVRHLVTNQLPVVGVEPERTDLERIFLEATRGELQ